MGNPQRREVPTIPRFMVRSHHKLPRDSSVLWTSMLSAARARSTFVKGKVRQKLEQIQISSPHNAFF